VAGGGSRGDAPGSPAGEPTLRGRLAIGSSADQKM
jgi:hypothetical protein